MKEAEDVSRADENIDAIAQQLVALNDQFKAETDSLEQASNPQTEVLESVTLKPAKNNIGVKLLTLAWAPYWQDAQGAVTPAWQ